MAKVIKRPDDKLAGAKIADDMIKCEGALHRLMPGYQVRLSARSVRLRDQDEDLVQFGIWIVNIEDRRTEGSVVELVQPGRPALFSSHDYLQNQNVDLYSLMFCQGDFNPNWLGNLVSAIAVTDTKVTLTLEPGTDLLIARAVIRNEMFVGNGQWVYYVNAFAVKRT